MAVNGRNLSVWVEAEVHPSPEELALLFWAMDAEEQAGFFNTLAQVSDGKLPIQLQAVSDSPHLLSEARRVMALIGGYAVRA